jgi:hypothetical protein
VLAELQATIVFYNPDPDEKTGLRVKGKDLGDPKHVQRIAVVGASMSNEIRRIVIITC